MKILELICLSTGKLICDCHNDNTLYILINGNECASHSLLNAKVTMTVIREHISIQLHVPTSKKATIQE